MLEIINIMVVGVWYLSMLLLFDWKYDRINLVENSVNGLNVILADKMVGHLKYYNWKHEIFCYTWMYTSIF